MSMKKGHDLVGLQVISQLGGENLGKVLDLVFDHDADECVAVVVKERDLFGMIPAQVVPWSEIITIGPDAVMVQSGKSRIGANDDPRIRAMMEREHALSGTRIYTDDGRYLGTFGDVYLDPITGRVQGYEVSGGFMTDTMSGKRYLPAEIGPDIGKDTVIVPAETANLLEQQAQEEPGGLKGAAKSASEKVSDTYSGIATASVEKQQEFVVGKTAAHDVVIPRDKAATMPASATTSHTLAREGDVLVDAPTLASSDNEVIAEWPAQSEPTSAISPSLVPAGSGSSDTQLSSDGEPVDGEILVRKGETITHEHAMRATEAGVLGKLVTAAVGGKAGEHYEALSGKAGEHYEAISGQAGEHGAGAQAKAEEAAIGKPSAKEVTLPNGTILLAPGQVVTRDIMEEARTHGKEKEVIAAAGLGAASEKLQTGAATVKEGATNLWDTIKEKTAELTGAAQDKKAELSEAAEQKRINHAVGRPTNRVILSPDDSVILNTGDIITHAAVNQAREVGVLEILLDSVSDVDPEITPEMLRVAAKGMAALDGQQEPSGGPITATVSPEARSQDTPSQGTIPPGGSVTANP